MLVHLPVPTDLSVCTMHSCICNQFTDQFDVLAYSPNCKGGILLLASRAASKDLTSCTASLLLANSKQVDKCASVALHSLICSRWVCRLIISKSTCIMVVVAMGARIESTPAISHFITKSESLALLARRAEVNSNINTSYSCPQLTNKFSR